MTFPEAAAWLNRLIDYEKQPSFTYATAFKLDRVEALMAELGSPERAWPAVHIAGTKAKGSVAAYIDALLRAHGHRTGLYTSPHLVSFRERIRIDGRKIGEREFARIITRVEPWASRWQLSHDEDRLSFFDVLTAVGFEAFRRAGIDWGVIEVGMGGRLDATNVVHPRVAVVMPISLEHTRYLGSTIAEIAREKAGIVKPGVPVVLGRQTDEAAAVLRAKCAEFGIAPTWMGKDVRVDEVSQPWTLEVEGTRYADLRIGMIGGHQRWNFAASVTAIHRAGVRLDPAVVRRVAAETVVPGRLQVFPGSPTLLLDVAHTPDSAERLVAAVREHFPEHADHGATLLFSCSRDKRVEELARILAPVAKSVILPGMPGIRLMPVGDVQAAWKSVHADVESKPSIAEAFAHARDTTPPKGLIVACGSFILVGAVMELIGYEPG